MTWSAKIILPAIALISALGLWGCSEKKVELKKADANQAVQCGGQRAGLSVPPLKETTAAIADHLAASKLATDVLVENVAKGDVAAQIELGLRYVKGDRITKNPDRAVALFQAAADQGNSLGKYFLGTAYTQGIGLPQDDVMAVKLWEEASRKGYPSAQYWLGQMIANGFGGISKDLCAAIPLFEVAAENGEPEAATRLGALYHLGQLGEPNYAEAAKWYRVALLIVLDMRAQYNLRQLIDERRVEWQPGDPGKPMPPQDPNEVPKKELRIVDPTSEKTG